MIATLVPQKSKNDASIGLPDSLGSFLYGVIINGGLVWPEFFKPHTVFLQIYRNEERSQKPSLHGKFPKP